MIGTGSVPMKTIVFILNQFVMVSSQHPQLLNTFGLTPLVDRLGRYLGSQLWSVGGWLWELMAPKQVEKRLDFYSVLKNDNKLEE